MDDIEALLDDLSAASIALADVRKRVHVRIKAGEVVNWDDPIWVEWDEAESAERQKAERVREARPGARRP